MYCKALYNYGPTIPRNSKLAFFKNSIFNTGVLEHATASLAPSCKPALAHLQSSAAVVYQNTNGVQNQHRFTKAGNNNQGSLYPKNKKEKRSKMHTAAAIKSRRQLCARRLALRFNCARHPSLRSEP